MKRQRYMNIDAVSNNKTFSDMRRWMKERKQKVKDLTNNIPQADIKHISYIQSNRSEQAITWIGHATFLIQMGGLNIVTDPVWAKRMGFQRRLTDPGISLQDMPEIDIVLISHGHYDHLDIPTLRRLTGHPIYLVPIGLKTLLARKGFQNVAELSWWEHIHVRSLRFTFVPAQHWTRRSLFDMNTSHWGGWMIEAIEDIVPERRSESVYFAGDSGYFRGFQMIAERFQVDIALMPIGAYEPEWFMQVSHMTPEEAVQGFIDLGAKRFIPMHYGTYRLADDTGPEALERLIRSWDARCSDRDGDLAVMKLGETLRITDHA